MKRFIYGLIVGLLLSLPVVSFAGSQSLHLIVNGEDITANAQPIIINGRTLVPAGALAEKLGAKVEWDGATRTVIVTSTRPSTNASPPIDVKSYRIGENFQIGETVIKCNGISYTNTVNMNPAGADEKWAVIEFDILTNEEPTDFYHMPYTFIQSVNVDGKDLTMNFHSKPDVKIYKGKNESVTVYRLIPSNKEIDSIKFRSNFAGPSATVIVD